MKKTWLLSLALIAAILVVAPSAFALQMQKTAIKESVGDNPGGAPTPCPLGANLNGTCANLRYYNVCTGYIWIYTFTPSQEYIHVGLRYDGPCIHPGNTVKRAITYWRNVVPNYFQTVDVYLDNDANNDGCPDNPLAPFASETIDPGLRWNCSNFGTLLPASVTGSLVVRARLNGPTAPHLASDLLGPFHGFDCGNGTPGRSFVYGTGNPVYPPPGNCADLFFQGGDWDSATGRFRYNNFHYYLVVDGLPGPNATENTSWGKVKGLFQ
jgi:hypothetical protein